MTYTKNVKNNIAAHVSSHIHTLKHEGNKKETIF